MLFMSLNKSVCQKLARSCKKWKSAKIRYTPFLREALQEQGLKAFEARPEGALRSGLKGLKALIWKAAGKNVP